MIVPSHLLTAVRFPDSSSCSSCGWMLGVIAVIAILVGLVSQQQVRQAKELRGKLADLVSRFFLVQPCSRCHETSMTLLDVSPNGRSVHYKCQHCHKKMRAAAAAPEASSAPGLFADLRKLGAHAGTVTFVTPESPLPYEQTTREPIPESVRSEVWRRDKGCCVKCGSRQQLEFDHIIPVSRGGATTVRNLQLLCKPCNQAKSTSI